MKTWYLSKTVWVAILQAIVGFLTAIILLLQQGLTTEAMAALGLGVKGLIDLKLRFVTNEGIN